MKRFFIQETKTFKKLLSSSTNQPSVSVLLGLIYFATFIGYNIWRSTFHNYAIENLKVDAVQIGSLFALMGIPGIFAFSIGLIAKKIRIFPLLIFSCTMLGLGLIWIDLMPTWHTSYFGVLAISLGFISFYPLINGLCLLGSQPSTTTIRMGQLKSFGPLATVGSALLIFTILPPLGFRPFLIIIGIAVLLCSNAALLGIRNKDYAIIKGNLRPKSSLWPYYTLNFLAGCRSALFKAFVLFLLVKEYHFNIHSTAMIVLASNLLSFFSYRLIGQIASRYDNRNVLSVIYTGVAMVFLGFCFVESRLFLAILFLLDSVLFCTSVITDSYLKERVGSQDLIGDLASGLTLFYLAGVVAPLLGGLLWEHFDQRATFLLGSVLAILSILASRKL